MYEAGNKTARPNLISYVSLINAIARSRDDDCAERAEGILFYMYKQYRDGNKDVKPNAKLIAMVLDCWQKSGKPNAGERAEALLDWMLDIYETENDETFEPNEYIYSSGAYLWLTCSKTGIFGIMLTTRLSFSLLAQSFLPGASLGLSEKQFGHDGYWRR